jgi:hypothetical protein
MNQTLGNRFDKIACHHIKEVRDTTGAMRLYGDVVVVHCGVSPPASSVVGLRSGAT